MGDRFPVPLSPLSAKAGAAHHLREAWDAVFAEAGLRPRTEPNDPPATAIFGGRLFLNTSLLRQLGEHATGADPCAFTRQYHGERADVSRQHRRTTIADAPERVRNWAAKLEEHPTTSTAHRLRNDSRQHRTRRPRLERLAPGDLLTRLAGLRRTLVPTTRALVHAELALGLRTELITRLTEQAGQPTLAGELVTGTDPADHQLTSLLEQMSRNVQRSPTLTRIRTTRPPHLPGRRHSRAG